LPDFIRESFLAEDKTGYFVKHWVKEHCQMDDGLIPFLNFDQMAIYFHGQRFTIKDGVAGFLRYCALFKSAKGAINISCPCPTCLPSTNGKHAWS
jgi:hypothetical protein